MSTIPLKLFQTVESRDKLPYHHYPIEKQIESWKEQNPGLEINVHDRSDRNDLVSTHFGDYFSAYSRLPGVMQADVWRLMALHQFGGIYADVDTVNLRAISPLLESSGLLVAQEPVKQRSTEWNPDGVIYQNCILLSVPGHPLLSELLEFAFRKVHDDDFPDISAMDYRSRRAYILETTGPNALTAAILRHGSDQEASIRIAPMDWFSTGFVDPKERLSAEECREHAEQIITKYRTEPGPFEGEPVYAIHTHMRSWYARDKGFSKLFGKLKRSVVKRLGL